MNKGMLNKTKGGSDRNEYYTPEYAVQTLIPYLKTICEIQKDILGKKLTIWEPTDESGEKGIVTALKKSDIPCDILCTGLPSVDFLTLEKPLGDIVVTNPPYGKNLKERFVKRLYEWNIPWAMLMPLSMLEGVDRGKMWRKKGIELLVHNRRIGFIPGAERPRGDMVVEEAQYKVKMNVPWFNSSWFCYGILPEKLIFTEVKP